MMNGEDFAEMFGSYDEKKRMLKNFQEEFPHVSLRSAELLAFTKGVGYGLARAHTILEEEENKRIRNQEENLK
jgi:hypothetical protein